MFKAILLGSESCYCMFQMTLLFKREYSLFTAEWRHCDETVFLVHCRVTPLWWDSIPCSLQSDAIVMRQYSLLTAEWRHCDETVEPICSKRHNGSDKTVSTWSARHRCKRLYSRYMLRPTEVLRENSPCMCRKSPLLRESIVRVCSEWYICSKKVVLVCSEWYICSEKVVRASRIRMTSEESRQHSPILQFQ